MIIAEFSNNHKGNPELLFNMVQSAAKAGAWACKIQTFFADDLSDYWKSLNPKSYEHVKSYELSFDLHRKFVQCCRDNGVMPMTSVYSFKYEKELGDCGFRHIKFGSPYCTDTALITNYIACGFNVFVSTGGTDLLRVAPIHPMTCVMHCVSKYPADPDEANLARLYEIKRRFPRSALGFSDHTCPTQDAWRFTAKSAMAMGAEYVEEHFTLVDRSETKDGMVSITPIQLKQLCDFDKLEQCEKARRLELQWLISSQSDAEKDLIHRYKGRFIQ